MLPPELLEPLKQKIAAVDHPRELTVDVMFVLQKHYGYLSDEALKEGAGLLGPISRLAGGAGKYEF